MIVHRGLRIAGAFLAVASALCTSGLNAKAKVTFVDCEITWNEKTGPWNSATLRGGKDQNSFMIEGGKLYAWLSKRRAYVGVCDRDGLMYVPESAKCSSEVSKKKWAWAIDDPTSSTQYSAKGTIDVKAMTITKDAKYTLGNGKCVAGRDMRT